MGLDELARIIDSLYAIRRAGRVPKKKLVVVVGNGIQPVSNILNDSEVRKRAKAKRIKTARGRRELKWRLFEYSRYYTTYSLPNFAHAAIHRLVVDQVCSHVITTNYDMSFDSIWSKYPDLGVRLNPVLGPDQYGWDDYYSQPDPTTRGPCYWKIHGSLSHIAFRGKHSSETNQVHRLPRFALSNNQPDLPRAFGRKTLAPFLGFESNRYPATVIPHPHHIRQEFVPFIDWTFDNDREPFKKEIAAVRSLLDTPDGIAAILLIGFRGRYNWRSPKAAWNEEIVPDLYRIIDADDPPVFMAVHKQQAASIANPTSGLMRRLDSMGRCFRFDHADDFIHDLFRPIKKFPYGFVEAEYRIWRSFFFLPMRERHHV